MKKRFGPFPNGYEASVVCFPGTYGYEQGLFELAVMKDDRCCYSTPITSDVIGYLTWEQAMEYVKQVENLPC